MAESASDSRTVAVIGLGKMGLPMATQLVTKSFAVRGFDLNEDAIAALARVGGIPCGSVKAAVSGSGIVITMLPDSHAVDRVVLSGPDPLVAHMAVGTLLIEMSSSSPTHTKTLGETLEKGGIAMVDAPVSGGVARAADGTLTIMVGGPGDAVARARPVLEALGRAVFATGPLGSGHAMKALNNYVSAAGLVAACEALDIGTRFGLDSGVMTDILNVSTGRNNSTENKIKQFVLSGRYDGGFGLGLMAKDVRTAADLADDVGAKAPICHGISRLWGEAQDQLGGTVDHTEIDRYLRSL